MKPLVYQKKKAKDRVSYRACNLWGPAGEKGGRDGGLHWEERHGPERKSGDQRGGRKKQKKGKYFRTKMEEPEQRRNTRGFPAVVLETTGGWARKNRRRGKSEEKLK